MAKKTTGDGTHQKGAKHGYMYGQGFEVLDSRTKSMMKSGSSIQAYSKLSNCIDAVFAEKTPAVPRTTNEWGLAYYFKVLILKKVILS